MGRQMGGVYWAPLTYYDDGLLFTTFDHLLLTLTLTLLY